MCDLSFPKGGKIGVFPTPGESSTLRREIVAPCQVLQLHATESVKTALMAILRRRAPCGPTSHRNTEAQSG